MATLKDSPVPNGHKPEKKHKKDKNEKNEKKDKKKRSREDDPDTEAGESRKHKRSKSTAGDVTRELSPDLSVAAPAETPEEISPGAIKSDKKKKKNKKDKHAEANGDEADAADEGVGEEKKKKRRKSKHKDDDDGNEDMNETVEDPFAEPEPESPKKDRKKKKRKTQSPQPQSETEADPEVEKMDIDTPIKPNASTPTSRLHQPHDAPAKPQYPFFTQTVSLFLPLYPTGWAEPCTAAATQHLEPMVNRYVPSLGGVLLAFRDIAISQHPGDRSGNGVATSDSERCDLISLDESAVGFGWVTAEVDLFVPRRGAWMEGSINLESEGHVGVVCWGKFNASMESVRLPPAWRWVDLTSDEAAAQNGTAAAGAGAGAGAAGDDTVSNFTAEQEHGAVRQIHATGYWVDEAGRKVKGRVRFRIKSFDVGVSGDHGYLSLEGTMLDVAGEKEALRQDAERELRRRKGKSAGMLVKERRLVPEFSVTRFGEVEDEEEKALRQDVWNTTEPVTDNEGAGGAAGGDKEEFAGTSEEVA